MTLNDNTTQEGKLSNVEALEHTYYEYHGWYDDGTNVADALANGQVPTGFSEVIAV